MNELFGIMYDVAALVTRGSDRARMEARRIPAECASRVATSAVGAADKPATAVDKTAEWHFARRWRWLKMAFASR